MLCISVVPDVFLGTFCRHFPLREGEEGKWQGRLCEERDVLDRDLQDSRESSPLCHLHFSTSCATGLKQISTSCSRQIIMTLVYVALIPSQKVIPHTSQVRPLCLVDRRHVWVGEPSPHWFLSHPTSCPQHLRWVTLLPHASIFWNDNRVHWAVEIKMELCEILTLVSGT